MVGKVGVVRILLLLLSIAMMGIGLANKEMQTVFLKAVNLCMECIGIG